MRLIKEKPIILVPLLLLGAFFLLHEEKGNKTSQASVAREEFLATGFPDYDLLPVELKKRMEELVQEDTQHRYEFTYFFEKDDINRHYFLEDNPQNMIVSSMQVEQKETLALVEERMLESSYGFDRQFHPDNFNIRSAEEAKKIRKTAHRRAVSYIFPEGEADFRQLRVGIAKDTVNRRVGSASEKPDTNTYRYQDVDQFPVPVRGMDYFHDVLRQYLEEKLVYFSFYEMEGEIRAEFTIGTKTGSPQVVNGFSSRYPERDEAYKLDGLIVKALNEPKVRWQRALKNGKKVNTRVGMTFNFTIDEEGNLHLNMSGLNPATKAF